MVEGRLEDIKKEIRSVLISSKEGMTLQDFLKAYRSLLGIRFPSRQLGFTTDIELIESLPDVVCLKTDRNGSFVLTAIADETTEHIQKLVRKQKSNKKKSNNTNSHIATVKSSIFTNNVQRNRPFVPAKLRGEILQILEKHPDGIGYTAFILDYNQTFSKSINLEWLSNNPSERFKKLVLAIPELELKTVGYTEKLFLSKRFKHVINGIQKDLDAFGKTSSLQSSMLLSISDKNKEKIAISQSLKENFEKILKDFPEGIIAVHFPILYQQMTGQQFNLHDFGFNSLLEMTDALPEIFVRIPSPKSSNDWILFHVDNAVPTDCQSSLSAFKNHSNNQMSSILKENVPNDITLPALEYIPPELPEEAKTLYVPVYVSSIINPSHFWFQLRTQDAILSLESLEKDMECFYSNLPNRRYKMADADIVVGATCAAFYAVDQHWYRVTIAALPSLNSAVVDFVDYGSSDQVPRSALYYLKYTFIHLPAQAYKAQLGAIKPTNEKNKWPKETNKRFIDLCNQIFLMAMVKAVHDSTFSVLLCDTSGDDDIHINDALVKEGYAEFHRNKDVYNTPPPLYLNTSESSSSSTPLLSPVHSVTHLNHHSGTATADFCRKKLFIQESTVKQQTKKYVKRLVSDDDYIVHILLVEKKAYVSVGDLNNLFWSDSPPDLLLTRLKYKNVSMEAITVSREDFPDLFEQCERFSVKGFDEAKHSVSLFPFQSTPKIINILGHPSKSVRNLLIKEIDNFNPENFEWKESLEDPEPYEEYNGYGNKLDRLCLHDLKARHEALRFKRQRLLDALQENRSDNLIEQMRNLDAIQNYISKRIKEVELICNEFSKRL